MGGWRRRYGYAGAALLGLWTLATYYMAIVKTQPQSKASPDPSQALASRLAQLEADLLRQKDANLHLLNLIAEHSKVTAPPSSNGEDGERRESLSQRSPAAKALLDAPVAVLVIACNRPTAIRNHLDSLLRLRPSAAQFPIIVSQDCGHEETRKVIESYGPNVTLIQHPDLSDIPLPPKQKKFLGYYKLNRHYKWALNKTFYELGHKTAIITEDDLIIAPDFFEYFLGTYGILRVDSSVWCVSAWNDNGKAGLIDVGAAERLRRTDLFPGLGWMLRRELWEELEPKWPTAFWDDWMRRPEQRKERACIRPEVSRTTMSKEGKVGVSKGLFFEKHLKHIVLNSQPVAFTQLDLSYLLKERYDPEFLRQVYAAPTITQEELAAKALTNGQPFPDAIRLTYDNKNTFKTTAKSFGLMDDYRAGVPRTAYKGVVEFVNKGTRVFLAPPKDWTGYDPSWT